MTPSTISANMATGRVSFPVGNGQPLAPAWVRSPQRQICEGSRPRADRLLNQANWWARPVPATTTDKSCQRHATAAKSSESHIGSPAPSLAVLHPGTPQRHSQIVGRSGTTVVSDLPAGHGLAGAAGPRCTLEECGDSCAAPRGRRVTPPGEQTATVVGGPGGGCGTDPVPVLRLLTASDRHP